MEGSWESERYYRLINVWVSIMQSQHTLLSAYLTAHAFLALASFYVFVAYHDVLISRTIFESLPYFILTLATTFAGLFLAIQMSLAWKRQISLAGMFMQEIYRQEKDLKEGEPKFMQEWNSRTSKREFAYDVSSWGVAEQLQTKDNFVLSRARARNIPTTLYGLYGTVAVVSSGSFLFRLLC